MIHIYEYIDCLQAALHYSNDYQAHTIGTIHYYFNNTFGQVCIDNTTNQTEHDYIGRVICRQLGLGGPTRTLLESPMGNNYLELRKGKCTGSESSLHTS